MLILFEGTVQIFLGSLRTQRVLIPKITVVLQHLVFRTKSTCTIVLVVDIFTSHELPLLRSKQEVVSINMVQFLCLRQACMTCAIANECQCVYG